MGYILGIDQGGTKTHAAIMDADGNMVSCHRSGGCYFPNEGIENAAEYIMDAVEHALSGAGIAMGDVDMVVAGVTGIDWPGDEAFVTDALSKRMGDKEIIACNDCEIAYYSGSMRPAGAVICAGTGLNVALFAPNGAKLVLGDYLKSSLQGGSAIAKRAFEAVVESDLGVLPETKLAEVFCGLSGDKSVYDLLRRMMTTEHFAREITSAVPKIIETAGKGDLVAQGVLAEFSDALCRCFAAAMKKMDMLDLACDVVLAGSVFKGRENSLRDMVQRGVLRDARSATIVNAKFEPIVGACIMGGIKKAGAFDEGMIHNATVSAGRMGLLRM